MAIVDGFLDVFLRGGRGGNRRTQAISKSLDQLGVFEHQVQSKVDGVVASLCTAANAVVDRGAEVRNIEHALNISQVEASLLSQGECFTQCLQLRGNQKVADQLHGRALAALTHVVDGLADSAKEGKNLVKDGLGSTDNNPETSVFSLALGAKYGGVQELVSLGFKGSTFTVAGGGVNGGQVHHDGARGNMVKKFVCAKDEVINTLVISEAIHNDLSTSKSCREVSCHGEACGLKDGGALRGAVPGGHIVAGLLEVCGHTATHGSHTQIRDLRHL